MSSSSSSSIYRIPIVTTTIFDPSATSYAQPASDNGRTIIPIGSIVGGCLAGITLAVAAVVGWHLWGRSIKQKEEAKRKEAVRSPSILSFLIPPYYALPSDIIPHYKEKHEAKRVRLFPTLLHPLFPGTRPGSQSQVCRPDIKYPVRQGQPIAPSLSCLSAYTVEPPLKIGGYDSTVVRFS